MPAEASADMDADVRRLTAAESARAEKARAAGSAPRPVTALQVALWALMLAVGGGTLAMIAQATSTRLSDQLLVQDGPIGEGIAAAVNRPGSPDYFETLAELAMDQAPADLASAKAAAEKAVALEPTRAHAWARLAYLDWLGAKRLTPAGLDALGKSFAACPLCDAGLIRWRFNFVLANWGQIPEPMRRQAFEGADLLRWAGGTQDADFVAEMRTKAESAGIPFDAYRRAVQTPVKSWDVRG